MEGGVWLRAASLRERCLAWWCVLEGGVWLRAGSWRAVFGLELLLGGRRLVWTCVLEGGVWLKCAS